MLIRPLNFTQNDVCAASDKTTNFNISKNSLCLQGNSLMLVHYFEKTNLKQGGQIHKPRASRGRTAVRFPANRYHMFHILHIFHIFHIRYHMCCVERSWRLKLCLSSRGHLRRGFSPFIEPTAILCR